MRDIHISRSIFLCPSLFTLIFKVHQIRTMLHGMGGCCYRNRETAFLNHEIDFLIRKKQCYR